MKIYHFEKKLNNTELGKGGTHDTYVLVPVDVDITDIFPAPDQEVEFTDYPSGEKVVLRNTVAREKRIVGLGEYYRSKNLNAGDDIIFERRVNHHTELLVLTTRKYDDIIVAQKNKYGFEILTSDRWSLLRKWKQLATNLFSMPLRERRRKRADSPEETDFYDVIIDDESILDNYKNKEMIILKFENNQVRAHNFCNWKKTSYDVEV